MKIDATGNIFFDAGYYMFYHIFKGKSLEEKEFSKDEITTIINWMLGESRRWLENKKNKFAPYFLNHPIANTKKSNSKRFEETKEKLTTCLEKWQEVTSVPCAICGKYESMGAGLSRVELPLAGSLQGRNFYPGWGEGIKVCGICAIKSYASIFATVNSSGRIILLNSNSPNIMKLWIEKIARSKEQLAKQNLLEEKGPITLSITNKMNALYSLLERLIENVERSDSRDEINSGIEFIYYTNFAAGAEIEIFPISHHLFLFFIRLQDEQLMSLWRKFVYQFYTSKKLTYDESSQKLFLKQKKTTTEAQKEEYENNRNTVIDKIIKGQALGIKEFTHTNDRKLRVDYHIIELYFEEVLEMEKERIDFIKKVVDLIAGDIRERTLKLDTIEKVSKPFEFERFLIQAARKHVQKSKTPLITLDDYVTRQS